MFLVAGLGNPGAQYAQTPHNAGFAVVEELAGRMGGAWRRRWRFQARTAKGMLADKAVVLVQPLTYMNRSGEAVGALMRHDKIEPGNVVLVVDDADLPLGRVRVRPAGGSGGHRGLASVFTHAGTDALARVRVGIGRRGRAGEDLVAHVLRPLTGEDARALRAAVALAADAAVAIVTHGVADAMNRFNGLAATAARDEQESLKLGEPNDE